MVLQEEAEEEEEEVEQVVQWKRVERLAEHDGLSANRKQWPG